MPGITENHVVSQKQLFFPKPLNINAIGGISENNKLSVPCKSSRASRKGLFIDTAAGWIGGAIGIAVTHPIDSLRVAVQYNSRILNNNLNYGQLFRQIINTHGYIGLYRGILPPTILRGVGLAVNRAGYNMGMSLFEGETVKGTWRIWVVGSIAGMCGSVVELPVQLLKCRSQVKVGLAKETFKLYGDMIRKIWKYEGFRAFTNGLIPQVLYYGISFAIFYALYDYLLIHGFSIGVAGIIAGTLSWPPVIPFDALRVRMQCQPYNVQLSTVVIEMGRQPINRWFSGLGATLLRAAPRWGITMVAIERSTDILKVIL